jgi:hypothetical protein
MKRDVPEHTYNLTRSRARKNRKQYGGDGVTISVLAVLSNEDQNIAELPVALQPACTIFHAGIVNGFPGKQVRERSAPFNYMERIHLRPI